MSDAFTKYVDEWDAAVARKEWLVAEKAKLTQHLDAELKLLTESEMTMRKSIAASVVAALGEAAKEGVNKYTLPDGRKLKLTVNKTRTIDPVSIALAREEWSKLNEHSKIDFDTVFRVKHELDKAMWNKTTDGEKLALSRCVVTKDAAPVVVFD